MSVTQEDIAKRLGVGRELVTRALNGSTRVSETSRERIWACAKELGYDQHTNREARQLSARRLGRLLKCGVIAIVVPHSLDPPILATPFFDSLLRGLQAEAQARSIDLYLNMHMPGSDLPRVIRDRGVDGVVCLSTDPLVTEQLRQFGVPEVTVIYGNEYGFALMVADRQGTREATSYLVGLGHNRIAYLGPPPNFLIAEDRFSGYLDGLAQAAINRDDDLVETTVTSTKSAGDSMERLYSRCSDLTAIVCYNDAMAINAVRRLQAKGLKVPEDISVVGFDDIAPDFSFQPALTSVAVDLPAIGRRAVAVIANHADSWSGKLLADVVMLGGREVFPVKLAIRDSTAKPRHTPQSL